VLVGQFFTLLCSEIGCVVAWRREMVVLLWEPMCWGRREQVSTALHSLIHSLTQKNASINTSLYAPSLITTLKSRTHALTHSLTLYRFQGMTYPKPRVFTLTTVKHFTWGQARATVLWAWVRMSTSAVLPSQPHSPNTLCVVITSFKLRKNL
jgi:hypothetical protein